jgi:hypothetical protein
MSDDYIQNGACEQTKKKKKKKKDRFGNETHSNKTRDNRTRVKLRRSDEKIVHPPFVLIYKIEMSPRFKLKIF